MTDGTRVDSTDAFATRMASVPDQVLVDFDQPADVVAPQLLGGILRLGHVAVRITEVEAYLGESDPASHAFKGPTPRCATMFGPSSHLYVYASYGIHRAGNLVCSPDGHAGGVLLRGGEVVAGYNVARRRRGPKALDAALARGPGNLGQAMGFDLELNGAEVRQSGSPDFLALPDSATAPAPAGLPNPVVSAELAASSAPAPLPVLYFRRATEPVEFVAGKRIGISKNVEAPLRFWIPGDPTVSTPRGRPKPFKPQV